MCYAFSPGNPHLLIKSTSGTRFDFYNVYPHITLYLWGSSPSANTVFLAQKQINRI